MINIRSLFGFVASLLAASHAAAQSNPVETESGLLSGISQGSVTSYRGVPFAAPPVGDLRWRAPVGVTPWEGVRSADAFAPMCMTKQPSIPGGPMEATSEDCLYLNVWAPSEITAGAKLPVMVWLYGGGMRAGSASSPTYWGDKLAQKGVITVNLSYRTVDFGFLSHPHLSAEGERGTSGNYGLLDMIAGLRWIQDNIAAFGGDPHNVTLFGQSAGSFAVNYLMASPPARGLFHKAIGQSGADMEPLGIGLMPLVDAEAAGVRLAEELGAQSITNLRAMPAEEILEADAAWPKRADGSVKGGTIAVVDGYVLPGPLEDVFGAGEQADVPLLVGFNADEGTLFVREPLAPDAFVEQLRRDYGALADQAIALYPSNDPRKSARSQVELIRDNWYGWAVRRVARLHAATKNVSVYVYRFSYVPDSIAGTPLAALGASHGFELNNVFGHASEGERPSSRRDIEVIDMISFYWTSFAKTGDPNGAGLPLWPRFEIDDEKILEMGRAFSARYFTIEETQRLDLQENNFERLKAKPD